MSTEKRRWAYTGVHINPKGQLGHQYCDETSGETYLFGPKARPSQWPEIGRVYEVTVEVRGEADLSFTYAGKNAPKRTGDKADPRLVAEWVAQDQAEKALHDQQKLERKAAKSKDDEFHRALDVLRDIYRKVPYTRKRALLAYMTEYMTR